MSLSRRGFSYRCDLYGVSLIVWISKIISKNMTPRPKNGQCEK